jgi:uncharacterized repeat protein (TIGR01451 family)
MTIVKGKWTLVTLLLLAALVLGICLFCLARVSQAQGGIVVDKRLGRATPVVRVGEYLTFTIAIRSEASFTIVTLPLSDTFDSYILAYADADPPPNGVTTTTNPGQLLWFDLTDTFGDLSPGQTITVTLGFTAVHPTAATVNAARVEGAEGSSGEQVGEAEGSAEGETVGGSTPVQKSLDPPTATLRVNSPITFTITITNDGAATLTFLPLEDTYDPAVLLFHRAIPAPSLVLTASGVISWFDLTVPLGDVPPDSAVTVTTVFTALMPATSALNSARVAGARDQYENDLAAGADQVPIMIIEDTPVPAPTSPSSPSLPTPTPWSTATPAPTVTPSAIPSLTPTLLLAPSVLPETGDPRGIPVLVLFSGLVAVMGLTVAVWGWREVIHWREGERPTKT